MKKYFILIFSSFFLLLAMKTSAQQDAHYTYYMYNTQTVNPAYAGTRNSLSLSLLHRSQWVGFEGAPVVQSFVIHSPVIHENIGIGASVVNDKIGPVLQTSADIDFSYKFTLHPGGKLSLGLKSGLKMLNADFQNLEVNDLGDENFSENVRNEILPNVGFGAYYYRKNFYAGISVPKIIRHRFGLSAQTNEYSGTQRNYYLIAGGLIRLSETWKLRPASLLKYTQGFKPQADFSFTGIYKDKFWAGLMYRTGAAAGVLLGINISERAALGYAFDFSFGNKTLSYNYGSHELFLQYDFALKKHKTVISPRYF